MDIPQSKLVELAEAVERMQEYVDTVKEDMATAMSAAKAVGIDPKALRLALSIKKAKPTKAKAFLDSFDACRDALGLDTQLDLVDAIEAMDVAAGDVGATVTDGDGNELARFGDDALPARKGRGRRRAVELN